MTKKINCLTQSQAWLELQVHQQSIAQQHMRDWFSTEPERFSTYSLACGELLLDYSRNLITPETLRLLSNLAHSAHLTDKISALYSGHLVNTTERRAALHTALRSKNPSPLSVNGENIGDLIFNALDKMRLLTTRVHQKSFLGVTGKPIKHIVTIGVGGSYLATMMCCHALKDFNDNNLKFHFISSVDKAMVQDVLEQIDPETTLFIIASKTFSTLETMTNANTLAIWMKNQLGSQVIKHQFIGITSNLEKARAFGLADENTFPIWDWVGGRYSIWSAIGLPLMLMIGCKEFDNFLAGAHLMDKHFEEAPFTKNIPVMLAMLSIWYRNFFHASAQAVIPYAHRLRHFVPYLQQADMESNGKSTNLQGEILSYATGPIIFGEEGCNGQHSYHQLLHQGQHFVPVDFILLGKNGTDLNDHHHDILLASGLSQAQALMAGKTYTEAKQELTHASHTTQDIDWLAQHQVNPGNRPSNILFLERLTPKNLGTLLALYEHKIFVQGVIWNINSFDQWGVELGKQLLPNILNSVRGKERADMDSATKGLILHLKRAHREESHD